MLAVLGRLLKNGLCLMSLRSLGLAADLRRCTRMQIKAARYTAMGTLSGVLAILAGFGAILLWVSPSLRPALLACASFLLALGAVLSLYRGRALRRSNSRLLLTALQSIQTDLLIIRKMFDQDPDDCSQCRKHARSDQDAGRKSAQGRDRASCDG
jgi:hypothetical protein